MTGHEYLERVLKKQTVSSGTISQMQSTRDAIESALRKAIGWGPRFYYAGSYGKDTMLAAYHDLDLVVYFSSDVNKTLKDIYWVVFRALRSAGYVVQQKDVAIRLPYEAGFNVDVVPGRAMSSDFIYANLYRSSVDSRLQTSIKTHIDAVRGSGLRGTMRLMKLWNVRHDLGVRSFFIELLVNRVLAGRSVTGYDNKLAAMFSFIAANIESVRIVDPANSNSVISDLMSTATKQHVAWQARAALDARYWSEVVW